MTDVVNTPLFTLDNPKKTWEWDMFGNGAFVITMSEKQRAPSFWQRLWTRFFFRSKWTNLENRQ